MAEVKTTCREELLAKLREDPVWDVVVIGGGATGAGIAVDAASPRPQDRRAGGPGLFVRHVVPFDEADSRRRALHEESA